jgi:hypothetical protein
MFGSRRDWVSAVGQEEGTGMIMRRRGMWPDCNGRKNQGWAENWSLGSEGQKLLKNSYGTTKGEQKGLIGNCQMMVWKNDEPNL